MGARRRLVALTALLSVGISACSSCKRQEATPSELKPPDHLAPAEVVEGKERAFGLPLPHGSSVGSQFPTSMQVRTRLTPEDLVNFVKARVKDGTVMHGTSVTQLFAVTPLAAPEKRLTIDVRPYRDGDGNRSEMLVQDFTAPPTEPGLTDEQRWKKAGLTPSGLVADPTKLQ